MLCPFGCKQVAAVYTSKFSLYIDYAVIICATIFILLFGFHVYSAIWEPFIGEELQCTRDEDDDHD